MSHRAHIAIQRGSQYDLYYSHNGAHKLQLLDQLRENAAALCSSASSPAQLGMSTDDVNVVQRWGSGGTATNGQFSSQIGDDIDAEPIATGVPAEQVGAPVEYDTVEAFYLVEDGSVTPYVPIWLWPDVIRPLREALHIEVYRGGRLDNDPAKMVDRLETTDPLAVINEDTIGRGADWFSDPVISEILRDHHAAIIALWKTQLDKNMPQIRDKVEAAADDETPDPTGILHLDNYVVQFRVLDPEYSPPPSMGLGMLVELPIDPSEVDRENIWFRGSKTRFNIGAGLNAMRSDPDNEDISGGIADVFLELYEAFGDQQISPRSPSPIGPLVRKLDNMVANRDEINNRGEAIDTVTPTIRDLFTNQHPDHLDLPDK